MRIEFKILFILFTAMQLSFFCFQYFFFSRPHWLLEIHQHWVLLCLFTFIGKSWKVFNWDFVCAKFNGLIKQPSLMWTFVNDVRSLWHVLFNNKQINLKESYKFERISSLKYGNFRCGVLHFEYRILQSICTIWWPCLVKCIALSLSQMFLRNT